MQTNNQVSFKVRFKDCDSMGHVNNAVYLTYIEEARIDFFNNLLPKDWNWIKDGIIIRKNEIEYLKPLKFGDIITINTQISNLKTKSLELTHKIYLEKDLISQVKSILVYFDYSQNNSKTLDNKILKFISNE
jgi:acyl-CoA thioester hydrolase